MLLAPTTTTFLPSTGDALVLQQFDNAIWCAGRKQGSAHHETPYVVEMESINIFVRRNSFENLRNFELRRKGKLNQDAVNIGAMIKVFDQRENFLRHNLLGEVEP